MSSVVGVITIAGLVETLFLSYRRSDAEAHAGRLYDTLADRLPDMRVFMDVDAIGGGEDFVRVLDQTLSSIDIMLVLIGKTWLNAQDETGRRRLDDPDDFVRVEVARALQSGVPLIPILVQGAVMPKAGDLPEPIADLAKRQAIELRHGRWQDDVGRLMDRIDVLLEETRIPRLLLKGGRTRRPGVISGLNVLAVTIKVRLSRLRRRLVPRSATWKLVKRIAYVAMIVAAFFVARAAYRYYLASDQRAIEHLAAEIRYENPQENVVGAILAMRNVVTRSSDPQTADLAIARLKAVVLSKDDTTDKGRAIRENALETIKLLRGNDLTRDFGDGTLKGADLVSVDLSRSNLKNVTFEDGFLIRTDFSAGDLSGVNLSGAWARNADFAAATMTGANVDGLDWFNAKGFAVSQLRSVDLSTLGGCPKDSTGRYSVEGFQGRLSKEYDFQWDRLGRDRSELLTVWAEYSKLGGLCEVVATWLK